ncbi:MAG: surF1 family protein [Caulobacteraceae bacterium]|jgi:surfeit locus 1 family protein|nr:surF1 family protein [Caulobacteraceae bacterium]
MSEPHTPASPWGSREPPGLSFNRPRVISSLLALIGFCILIGLGVWQLQRLKWKEDLLARIAALRTAPARPLETVLSAGGDLDYVRAVVSCPDLERRPTLRLFSVRDGSAGYRLVTVCPVSAGATSSILVDRGFTTLEQAAAAGQPGRAALPGPIVGVLRRGDKPTFVTPANQISQNLWYSRDVLAMAKTLGAARPAPVFLMLESPAPPAGGPTPAPVPIDIPNRHLEYAITWFGLAAALVGVYVAMLFRRRPD